MSRQSASFDDDLRLPPGGGDVYDQPDDRQATPVNPIKLVLRLIRGRLWVIVPLGLVGGIAGGIYGYRSQKPVFKAEGMVVVSPQLPVVLDRTADTGMPPMFTAFVNQEALRIRSDEVVSKAISSSEWQSLNRPRTPISELGFKRALGAGVRRDTQTVINVTFTDEDAQAAFLGLIQSMRAYKDVFDQGDKASLVKRKDILDRELADLDRDLDLERQAVLRDAREFGTDLELLHAARMERLLTVQDSITELNLRLAQVAPAGSEDADAGAESTAQAQAELTPEQLASIDPQMAGHLNSRMNLEAALKRLLAGGQGEQSREVKKVRRELALVDQTIADYMSQVALGKPVTTTARPGDSSGSLVQSPAQMRATLATLRTQEESLAVEVNAMGIKKVEMEQRRKRMDELEAEIRRIKNGRDALEIEARSRKELAGRIELSEPTSPPIAPSSDGRRKAAVLFAGFGGGLPVAIVLVLGLLDRRFRFAEEAKDTFAGAPLLGVLPDLNAAEQDPEAQASTAYCVHHIRTLMELGGEKRVFAFTSPTPGDGKTSVAMSLGLSFAGTGSKTLLVDFDFIGRGLTAKTGVRPLHSFSELLARGELNGSPQPTGTPGLSILPASAEDEETVNRLSSAMVGRLIDRMRHEYDAVLIDTGPILGSLEASMITASADGVVLVVGRGQRRHLLQAAVERLGQLGANVIGLIFNRASIPDFRGSVSNASIRSVRAEPVPENRQLAAGTGSGPDADPVAQALAGTGRR